MSSSCSSPTGNSCDSPEASPGSLVSDSLGCYPQSSSTILSSSPPVQTPPGVKDDSLNGASPMLGREKGFEHDSSISTSDAPAKTISPHLSDYSSLEGGDSEPPEEDTDKSFSCKKEEERVPEVRQRPRYYSLQTRASQIEFSKHLECLLLAVLGERSSQQEGSAIASETSTSQTSYSHTSVSPLQQSSPTAFAPRFIYVDVDEYGGHSQISDEDSHSPEGSHTSNASVIENASSRTTIDICHSSEHPGPDMRTPHATAVLCVPSAPKKVQQHAYVSDSSPLDVSRSVRPPERQIVESTTSNADCMRSLQPAPCERTKRSSVTPPQIDDVANAGPQIKKQKMTRSGASTRREDGQNALASRLLAKQPASLRRAASLRSEAPSACMHLEELLSDKPATMQIDEEATLDCALGLAILRNTETSLQTLSVASKDNETIAHTEPCSPLHNLHADKSGELLSPLPLIAPPPFEDIPRAPLTGAEVAEARIIALVKKDWEERLADGLSLATTFVPSGSGSEPETKHGRPSSQGVQHELGPSSSSSSRDDSEDIASRLGIRESFRIRVVQWMLDVVPPTSRSKPQLCSHLRKQLLESHDTRWHAAHLFTRYFLRLGVSPTGSPQIADESNRSRFANTDDKSARILTGKEALTWDLALACMALAVKFHRDVLPPLYPVTSEEFLMLSPHTIEYEDLESAQRDLFSALSFRVGSNTPTAYMDEFWDALASLRMLVSSRGNWQVTKVEAWELLSDTLLDAAYLNYPVHLLTGCALILGVVESLVLTMKAEAAENLKLHATGRAPRTKRREAECTCAKLQKRARKAVKYVEQDMRDLLDVPQESWVKCMRWLELVVEN